MRENGEKQRQELRERQTDREKETDRQRQPISNGERNRKRQQRRPDRRQRWSEVKGGQDAKIVLAGLGGDLRWNV